MSGGNLSRVYHFYTMAVVLPQQPWYKYIYIYGILCQETGYVLSQPMNGLLFHWLCPGINIKEVYKKI